MGKFIDMTGQRFGKLTALEPTERRTSNNVVMWLFKCDCGNLLIADGANVRRGFTKSCGSCGREQAEPLIGIRYVKHGQKPKRLYTIWKDMKDRCNNPNFKFYKHYGGRGIRVCDEWQHNFPAFRDWALANGYAEDLSIDRIDVNGNYEPGNCRWATDIVQKQNRRNCILVEYEGEKMCLAEYARRIGVSRKTAWARYQAQKRKKGQTLD